MSEYGNQPPHGVVRHGATWGGGLHFGTISPQPTARPATAWPYHRERRHTSLPLPRTALPCRPENTPVPTVWHHADATTVRNSGTVQLFVLSDATEKVLDSTNTRKFLDG